MLSPQDAATAVTAAAAAAANPAAFLTTATGQVAAVSPAAATGFLNGFPVVSAATLRSLMPQSVAQAGVVEVRFKISHFRLIHFSENGRNWPCYLIRQSTEVIKKQICG